MDRRTDCTHGNPSVSQFIMEQKRKKHYATLRTMKPTVDSQVPHSLTTHQNRHSRTWTYDTNKKRENQKKNVEMFKCLNSILSAKKNINEPFYLASLNFTKRKKDLCKLTNENIELSNRLNQVKSQYRKENYAASNLSHQKYLYISSYSKRRELNKHYDKSLSSKIFFFDSKYHEGIPLQEIQKRVDFPATMGKKGRQSLFRNTCGSAHTEKQCPTLATHESINGEEKKKITRPVSAVPWKKNIKNSLAEEMRCTADFSEESSVRSSTSRLKTHIESRPNTAPITGRKRTV